MPFLERKYTENWYKAAISVSLSAGRAKNFGFCVALRVEVNAAERRKSLIFLVFVGYG